MTKDRELENWIKSYMTYTRHLEAPDVFHFWAAVATVAGALQGKVWIDMGYWKWRPNFFIIFVAPPGVVTKSTTIGVGTDLLRQIPDVHIGPDSATWQGLSDAFLEATARFDNGPDIVETSSITIAASELGTLLDPKNREMVDLLVDLWDGRTVPWKRQTKGEGTSTISNPWLNFVGATTPAWLEANFPEYAIRGGFTSRTVFIFADRKRHFSAYPSTRINSDDIATRVRLVHDLGKISKLVGEFKLTPAAYAWGEIWYRSHWETRPSHLSSDRLSGYIARKQTHIHKLAMVLSAARSSSMQIEEQDLVIALSALEAIEREMLQVFDQVTDDPRAKHAQTILAYLKLHKEGMPKADLWREVIYMMSHQDFEATIGGLVAAGFINLQQRPGGFFIVPATRH